VVGPGAQAGDEPVCLVVQVPAVADQLVVFDFDGGFATAHVGTAVAASATLFATATVIAATIIAGTIIPATTAARFLAAPVVAFVRIRFTLAAALRLGLAITRRPVATAIFARRTIATGGESGCGGCRRGFGRSFGGGFSGRFRHGGRGFARRRFHRGRGVNRSRCLHRSRRFGRGRGGCRRFFSHRRIRGRLWSIRLQFFRHT